MLDPPLSPPATLAESHTNFTLLLQLIFGFDKKYVVRWDFKCWLGACIWHLVLSIGLNSCTRQTACYVAWNPYRVAGSITLPQKHFILIHVNTLIHSLFGPGLVLFFHSWVHVLVLHTKKLVKGCPKSFLNSHVLVKNKEGKKTEHKTMNCYTSNAFCSHLHNFILFCLKFRIHV